MTILRPSEPQRIALQASVQTPRQGEEGVTEVCQRLVDHLRSQGINWDRPVIPDGPEGGVDCICYPPEGIIRFQVTRALHDPEFFSVLGKNKSVVAYTTAIELAQGMWESNVDTSESALLFNLPSGSEGDARALGFSAIWLVGAHSELEHISTGYTHQISDAAHINHITGIADRLSERYAPVLANGRMRIGHAQKALNLYLKYLWSLDQIPEPPHCPIDYRIIQRLPGFRNVRWTKLDSANEYMSIIGAARQQAQIAGVSLPVWELQTYNAAAP